MLRLDLINCLEGIKERGWRNLNSVRVVSISCFRKTMFSRKYGLRKYHKIAPPPKKKLNEKYSQKVYLESELLEHDTTVITKN